MIPLKKYVYSVECWSLLQHSRSTLLNSIGEKVQHCVGTIISTASKIHDSSTITINTTMDYEAPPVRKVILLTTEHQ